VINRFIGIVVSTFLGLSRSGRWKRFAMQLRCGLFELWIGTWIVGSGRSTSERTRGDRLGCEGGNCSVR
jgi:hypothetical protein